MTKLRNHAAQHRLIANALADLMGERGVNVSPGARSISFNSNNFKS